VSFEAFLRFANAALGGIASAWERAQSEERLGVRTLLFQNAVRYSQERGNFEHLNPCPYSRMAGTQDKNWWLASPASLSLNTWHESLEQAARLMAICTAVLGRKPSD
jgi:hypothetical protein